MCTHPYTNAWLQNLTAKAIQRPSHIFLCLITLAHTDRWFQISSDLALLLGTLGMFFISSELSETLCSETVEDNCVFS